MNVPTTHSTTRLARFLEHARSAPIPARLSQTYLDETGFTGANDSEFLHIFQLLGFVDEAFAPTEAWRGYQSDPGGTLRQAIETTYADLFLILPQATRATDAELTAWFRPPITRASAVNRGRAIRTFRFLCHTAKIGPKIMPKTSHDTMLAAAARIATPPEATLRPQLRIEIPPLDNVEDYEAFFRAYRNVFGPDSRPFADGAPAAAAPTNDPRQQRVPAPELRPSHERPSDAGTKGSANNPLT